jgi:hypothetical protein
LHALQANSYIFVWGGCGVRCDRIEGGGSRKPRNVAAAPRMALHLGRPMPPSRRETLALPPQLRIVRFRTYKNYVTLLDATTRPGRSQRIGADVRRRTP